MDDRASSTTRSPGDDEEDEFGLPPRLLEEVLVAV